jgi:glycosyltransferase involved in cell wall biosynthesis
MLRKRILFFVPLPPPVHGAALRNKSLVESKAINDTFLVNVLPFDFAQQSEDIGKLSFVKIYKSIIRTFQIVRRILCFKPDLVYFNVSLYGFALYRDLFYTMIFKYFRCRILFHLRTQGVSAQVKRSKFKKKLFKLLFKNTHIICLSNFLTTDINEVYNGKPLIINNGIPDLSLASRGRKPLNPIPVILFLSNLAKAKGILELLEALKILNERQVAFHANIVGAPVDIPMGDLQEKVVDLSLNDKVQILGPIFGEEKIELLRGADVYTLPTYFEAFPGTILEAMQFSLPVVSTFEGAIPEIVDDGRTGFLIPKHNAMELAEKLQILLQDQDLRLTLGSAGRLKYLNNYTLEMFETNMKAAFEHVISR